MKKMIFIITTLALFSLNGLELGFSAKTGDAELDMFMSDVNNSAKIDLSVFKTETAAEFKVSNSTIDNALLTLKMEPAELYFSLEMAKVINKQPEEIMKVYSENKKQGWGVIAKKMGIKPGSKEFKALKAKMKYKKEKNKKEQSKKAKTIKSSEQNEQIPGGKSEKKVQKSTNETKKSGSK